MIDAGTVSDIQRRWRLEPQSYADVLGVDLWSAQVDALNSINEHKRTAIASGHNIGKTYLGGYAINWFLDSRPGSMVLLTAPTWQAVSNRIFREARTLRRNAVLPLGGEITQHEIKLDDDWKAIAMSTARPDAFQGMHAKDLLIVLDEAQGIEPDIWIAAESMLGTDGARMLAMGNPLYTTGAFFEAYHGQRNHWHGVNISCLEHPNIEADRAGTPRPYPAAVTLEWCEQIRQQHGERSPWYLSRVLGQFPPEGHDTLIPLAYLEQCADIQPPGQGQGKQDRHMGLDVARFGGDQCVAVLMQGMRVVAMEKWSGVDTQETARLAEHWATTWDVPAEQVHVDVTGIGGGVVDKMRADNWAVDPVDFGAGPGEDWQQLVGFDTKILNRRAYLYWTLRLLLRAKAVSIPRAFTDIWGQLTQMRYMFQRQTGKLQIEPKGELTLRLGRSPDESDAVICALSRNNGFFVSW